MFLYVEGCLHTPVISIADKYNLAISADLQLPSPLAIIRRRIRLTWRVKTWDAGGVGPQPIPHTTTFWFENFTQRLI